jgi:protein kinase-like protein/AraC-type transcriptional regulator
VAPQKKDASGNGWPAGGGKEELRAGVLKPYLLRLRQEKGEKAYRELLENIGLAPATAENETAWLSAAMARRALRALEKALGRPALARRGEWAVHPESLGMYVRLLRAAASPLDAYRQFCEHSAETTRVGSYNFERLDDRRVRITYQPIAGDEAPPPEELLSLAREAELASLPQFWGGPAADVTHEKSTAANEPASVYLVRWSEGRSNLPLAAAVGAGFVACGLPVLAAHGGLLATGLAAVVGGVFGGVAGELLKRMHVEQRRRVVEGHRIAALERGLSLRGDGGSEPTSPGELEGTVLGGRYKILRRIGSGGIGVVYSAKHVGLGTNVAIKVLRGPAAHDASEMARLRREAQVQGGIQHPNVVQTLDLDQLPDGSLYVVMELLKGRPLSDRLSREGPLAPGFAVPVFIQVCRALGAAHSKGVVHRDLKPGNIFLCEDGVSKVLDFGMSKFQSAESLTQEGYTLGTPEYMAPEQCIGAAVEPRTDLYAFGVLMYEALTGQLPIQSPNRRELLELHQRQAPLPMRERRPDLPIPQALDEAIMACLKKRVRERPRNAQVLEDMLSAIPLEGLPVKYDEPELPIPPSFDKRVMP